MFVSTRANHDGIARNRQFKFHKKWSGIRISTTRKKIHRQAKHTKQLFNQEANSLGWFLFTCWLEIPFSLHYQKKHVGISRNFSLKSHYQSSLQTHAHAWKKSQEASQDDNNKFGFLFFSQQRFCSGGAIVLLACALSAPKCLRATIRFNWGDE